MTVCCAGRAGAMKLVKVKKTFSLLSFAEIKLSFVLALEWSIINSIRRDVKEPVRAR